MRTFIFIAFCLFSSVLLAQEQKRDTLFIKYDNSLLTRKHDSIEKEFFYLIKGTGNSGLIYLEEKKVYKNLKPNKTSCFRNILKDSKAYYEKGKLSDPKLVEYLGKYIVFLVKGNKFIKVSIVHEIE